MRCVMAGVLIVSAVGTVSAQTVDLDALEAQLKKAQAEEAAQKSAAQRKAEAERKRQAQMATLVIEADAACVLRIDGEDMGVMQPGEVKAVHVQSGQQLVACVSTESPDAKVREVHDVQAGAKLVLTLQLAEQLKPTKTDTDAPLVQSPSHAADERQTYDTAFEALKNGQYAEAARRFQGFLVQYPNGAYSPNAQYWLGESYYVTQNYQIALSAFERLLTQFPSSNKAPDALLKVGYCHYELRQWIQAEDALNRVVRQYPGTTVARLAQGRLRALQLERK